MYPHARSLFSFPNGCSGQITLSAAMRCAYLKATHGHCDLRCWYDDDDDDDDDDDGDDDTKELPSSVSDCMTSWCRAFAELASSTHRFRSIRKCLFLCGLHRKGLRQQHHSCHGMRPQKRSTLLVASARALGSESSHRSDRSQRSMRQRPTWRRRRQCKVVDVSSSVDFHFSACFIMSNIASDANVIDGISVLVRMHQTESSPKVLPRRSP